MIKPGVIHPPSDAKEKAPAETKGAPETEEARQTWKFVKRHTPGQTLRFKDGTEYMFPWIRKNDGSGYLSSSVMETSDPKLAENLRGAVKAGCFGVIELQPSGKK